MGNISPEQMQQIERLQKNLSALRQIAGWTMEDLGNRVGVTKQTISNLENPNKDYKMTLTQYIAIRSVLDYEAEKRKDSDSTLKKVIQKLLDDDNLSEAVQMERQQSAQALGSVIAAGTATVPIIQALTASLNLSPLLGATAGIVGATGVLGWLGKLLDGDEQKKAENTENEKKSMEE